MRRLASVVVAIAVAATSCGDDDAAPTSDPPPSAAPPTTEQLPPATTPDSLATTTVPAPPAAVDPCSLLTAAEVEAVAGNPIADGVEEAGSCLWDAPGLGDVFIVMSAVPAGTPGAACADQRAISETVGPLQDVDLGTEAWYSGREAGLATNGDLYVCHEGGLIILLISGDRTVAELGEIAVELAGLALSRI